MKRLLKALGVLTALGSLGAGVYYFLVVRPRKPQVEIYFDDGSMVALPGDTTEAAPFMTAASRILQACPVSKTSR